MIFTDPGVNVLFITNECFSRVHRTLHSAWIIITWSNQVCFKNQTSGYWVLAREGQYNLPCSWEIEGKGIERKQNPEHKHTTVHSSNSKNKKIEGMKKHAVLKTNVRGQRYISDTHSELPKTGCNKLNNIFEYRCKTCYTSWWSKNDRFTKPWTGCVSWQISWNILKAFSFGLKPSVSLFPYCNLDHYIGLLLECKSSSFTLCVKMCRA